MDNLEIEKSDLFLQTENNTSSNDIFDAWDEDFQAEPIHIFKRPAEGEDCISCSG